MLSLQLLCAYAAAHSLRQVSDNITDEQLKVLEDEFFKSTSADGAEAAAPAS